MGSTGKQREKYKSFIGDIYDSYEESAYWFEDEDNSNSTEWRDELNEDEYDAIQGYTGSAYDNLNDLLYGKDWDDMTPEEKDDLIDIFTGLNKFQLYKGIEVTRRTKIKTIGDAGFTSDMSVDEIKKIIQQKGGVIQFDGFVSAAANEKGAAVEGAGATLHFQIPPSIGAGAYVDPMSYHSGADENEFLINNNALFKVDLNSIYKDENGEIHITMKWIGRATEQSRVANRR